MKLEMGCDKYLIIYSVNQTADWLDSVRYLREKLKSKILAMLLSFYGIAKMGILGEVHLKETTKGWME